MKRKAIAIEIICALFIILFVYAALSKLVDVQKFRIQIGQSPLLTYIAGFVAWFIPLSELAISVLLVMPKTRLIGLFASYGMMVMFTAYIIAILQFDGHIPCSCGGVLQTMGWTEHLIFNISFTAMALTGILILPKKEAIKGTSEIRNVQQMSY